MAVKEKEKSFLQSNILLKITHSQILGMSLVLLFLMIFMGLVTQGKFFRVVNLFNIMEQVTPIGIIAIGVTLVIITGGIDLSLGSVIALSGVIGAVIARDSGNFSGVTGIVVMLIVGSLCGLVNGLLIAYIRIPPFIVTLGMMTAARGLAAIAASGRPVGGLPESMTWVGTFTIGKLPSTVIIYTVVAIAAYFLLSRMKFGRHALAIGGNQNAARLCGVKIEKILVSAYILSGLAAGISGFILTTTTISANPTYGVQYELDAIASTVIGGTSLGGGHGSIPLCIVGTLIVGVINNGFNLMGIDPYWQQVIKGMIIVLAVALDQFKRRS